MEHENEPYRDEDGKLLVDFDKNVGSEGNEPQQHSLDVAGSNHNERPPTPVYDGSNSKCRKLIIKIKSGVGSVPAPTPVNNDSNSKCRKLLIKFKSDRESGPVLDGDGVQELVRDDYTDGGKGKKKKKGENRRSMGKKGKVEKEEKKPRVRKRGGEERAHDEDDEIKEMWDAIVGGNCEDDKDGVRTGDEDKPIDDSGVDPSHHYGSDNEHSPSQVPQPEVEKVDNEIEELFKFGKKKKKKETSPSATRLLVDSVLAELNLAAEQDAELNRQEKPCITKLRHLSLLTDIIPRKHLQQEFLDRGVLLAFKKWLEPVPDGSFPNINVREAVFKCLNDLYIDLDREDRVKQLAESDVGKAVMFFSKYDGETKANRQLAKQLVEKWSRVVFNLSTDYGDMKFYEVQKTYRRPPVKKATMGNAAAGASQDDDLDLRKLSLAQSSGASSSRQHASRPEAMTMDFVVRPQSKVDPEAVRAQAQRKVQDQHRAKLSKKLEQMKAPKRQKLQAVKPSVGGRGMDL
ncbi:protein IWS1 homolog 1-like [Salvia miltiorrhiza]|uniref:protein IWS1 homolog 1-like n=1 Tax=Salvia miltiorrhiza TaxID=226208 RepID=UPI0025AD9AB2|nr:protein IWS1 homolog 1-like [Salvia miltiorrhiza]